MKEIDFDELDRAVNSLMGTGSRDNEPDDENEPALEQQSAEASPAVDVSSGPAAVQSDDLAETNADDNEEPAKPEAASKPAAAVSSSSSRGRFMDVVRPSSREARRASLSSSVSRQGATLQPTSSASTPTSETSTPTAEEKPADEQPAPSAVAMTPEFSSAIPDLAVEPSTGITEPVTEETAEATPEPVEDEAPLTSPFIPDAKVEKRPLGRSSGLAPLADLEAELAENLGEAPAEKPSEDTAGTEQSEGETAGVDAQLPEHPLPAELNSELLSIESGANSGMPEMPTTQDMPQPEAESSAPTGAVVIEAAEPMVPPAAPAETNKEPVPAAPQAAVENKTVQHSMAQALSSASIPQQYKVQPKPEEDAPTGGIYDVQPLIHSIEKKPGWLLVLAIIGILLLGAAGGAAVYYLGLL